jgi:hypothetical protein
MCPCPAGADVVSVSADAKVVRVKVFGTSVAKPLLGGAAWWLLMFLALVGAMYVVGSGRGAGRERGPPGETACVRSGQARGVEGARAKRAPPTTFSLYGRSGLRDPPNPPRRPATFPLLA